MNQNCKIHRLTPAFPCHNDWANRSDPMGTTESYTRAMKTIGTADQNKNPDSGDRLGAESAWDRHSSFYARTVSVKLNEPQWAGKGSNGVTVAQTRTVGNSAPDLDPAIIKEGMKATDISVEKADKTSVQQSVVSYTDKNGHQAYTDPQPGKLKYVVQGHEVWSESARIPDDARANRIIGHSHPDGSKSFSPSDKSHNFPVMKNLDGHRGTYDMWYRGWRYVIESNGGIRGKPFRD